MECFYRGKTDWFRCRAAAIIIEEGRLLAVRNDRDPFHYLVGGGLRLHESSEEAVRREMEEEAGILWELEGLAYLHENFFTLTPEGGSPVRCHEIAWYYRTKPRGSRQVPGGGSVSMNGDRERLVWLPLDRIGEYDLLPRFLSERLPLWSGRMEHIVTGI